MYSPLKNGTFLTKISLFQNLEVTSCPGSLSDVLLNDNMAVIAIEIPIINRKVPVINVGILIAMGERKNIIIRNKESDFYKKCNTAFILPKGTITTVLQIFLTIKRVWFLINLNYIKSLSNFI